MKRMIIAAAALAAACWAAERATRAVLAWVDKPTDGWNAYRGPAYDLTGGLS